MDMVGRVSLQHAHTAQPPPPHTVRHVPPSAHTLSLLSRYPRTISPSFEYTYYTPFFSIARGLR